MEWITRHKGITAAIVATACAGLVFVLVWFQPQALFIDDVVDETLPQATPVSEEGEPIPEDSSESEPAESGTEDPSRSELEPGEVPPTFPLTLAEGAFIDLAHAGTGTALVVELDQLGK